MAKRSRKSGDQFTDQSPDDAPAQAASSRRWLDNEFWWKQPVGAPVHDRVVAYGKELLALYAVAHARDRVHERLYEGTDLRRNSAALVALARHGHQLARLNVSESIVNTLVSRLSKDKPMPSIRVDAGNWTLKRKAQKYRQFLLGEMNLTEYDALSREALVDGCVIGNGFTRIDDKGDGECVYAERMLREELLYDPRECKFGKPPNAIRVHRIARDHLIEMYPTFASQIANAEDSRRRAYEDLDDDVTKIGSLAAYTDVYEAIHLPRGEADGRRVYCISNATLVSESWDAPRFPWAMFRLQKPRRGIWAKGLIFKLKDIQHRINCIVRDMQMNLQATGRGFFLQQEANSLPIEMLTGWQPFSIKYKGNTAPQWVAPTPFNAAQLNALQYFVQLAHDISGVSQASAQSKSALGAGASGVALDTQYDIESDRFAMEEAGYADYRMQSSQLYIDASARVAKKRAARKGDKKSRVYVTGYLHRDAIQQLDYDKVSLEPSEYRLQFEPTNYLADTIAGKESAIGQLAQAGVIPQWLVAALFAEPDLSWMFRVTLGAFWNAERKMDDLAELDMEMPMPAPYNDLDLELKLCTAYINNAEAERAPDEILKRYRDYLDLLTAAKNNAAAGAAPPPGAAGPGGPASLPGAAPMLPPGAPMPGSGVMPGGGPSGPMPQPPPPAG